MGKCLVCKLYLYKSAKKTPFYQVSYDLENFSFKSEEEIKIFLHKPKLREFVTTKLAHDKMVKGLLSGEMKRH